MPWSSRHGAMACTGAGTMTAGVASRLWTRYTGADRPLQVGGRAGAPGGGIPARDRVPHGTGYCSSRRLRRVDAPALLCDGRGLRRGGPIAAAVAAAAAAAM